MVKKLKYKIVKGIVKLFGNIQFFPQPLFCLFWGDSHYKIRGPEMRKATDELKAGDIILRRYDRYVSGWFIPGFWTHVGIVSTKTKIIHASTKGVVEEDVMTYLRADHIEILRIKNGDKNVIKNALKKAKELLGKEYDFLFDTTDDERMYCTEVVKYCYPDLMKEAGEGSLPPDEVTKIDAFETIHSSADFRTKKED